MDPILDYYAINIIDIWPYERSMFFNEKTTEERIQLVEKKTIKAIIDSANLQQHVEGKSRVEPFTDLKRYDSGEHDGYWVRRLQKWDRASGNVYERVALDFFLHQDAFYSFTQDIEIDLSNEDFDFWFSLKLNQFDSGLKHLNEFLDYQLKINFQANRRKFNDHLQNVVIQYLDEILTNRVIQVVNNWCNKGIDETNPYQHYTSDYRTFCFLEISKDSTFIQRGYVLLAVSDLLTELQRQGFIDKELKANQFIKFFGSGSLTKDERFKWLKSNDSLKRFVLKMSKSDMIVTLKNKDKWLIARDCFIRRKGEELIEYDPENLENSSGKNSHATDSLEKMIIDFLDAIKKTPN